MSETGTDGVPINLDETERDTSRSVVIGGHSYALRSHLDIPMDEIEETLRIQADLAGKPWHEQLRLARRQVQILVPDLPGDALNRLTGRQIVRLMATVMGLESASV